MNRNIKARNFSASQTIQSFNSTKLFKTKEDEKLNVEDLEHIYNYFYEENFQNILIKTKFSFLNLIENKIQEVIAYNFDDSCINNSSFKRTINKFKKNIENKYLNDYTFLIDQYAKNENILKENERKYIYDYFQHCVNNKDCAHHLCSTNKKGKFILTSENGNKLRFLSKETKYVICLNCKQCYKSSCFKTICFSCNKEYYSSILKEGEDKNIVLATWEKYHCGGTLTDQIMKCIKCKRELYLNLLTNKLICLNKNCNFESKPQSILWKCIFCSKEFRSKAKAYNPLELQIIKRAINYTLLMKLKASPLILPCCKKDTKDLIFYHKEECKGILYKGCLKGKEILVCKKCHAMNFIDKFNWICPLCGKKFHSFHSNCVNPSNKNKKEINIKLKEKEKEKNNDINNNKNKMPTRIFFNKEFSESSLKKELDKLDKKDENLLLRNKNLKVDEIYYVTDKYLKSVENSNKDRDNEDKDKEKNGYIKISQNKNSRNNYIKEKINTENGSVDVDKRKNKKNRITLFELLEKRKKKSLDGYSIKDISLKKTIDSILIENNFNRTKNMENEKLDIKDKNLNLLIQESSLENNVKDFDNIKENKEVKSTKKIILDLSKFQDNIKEDIKNRNINFPSYMNSSENNLSKRRNLIKCKSSNLFKEVKNHNNKNEKENSNKYKDNHQTNYLYTNNSNYNIKVSLNINHNICPYSQNEEKNSEKQINKDIYPSEGLNQIDEIYIQEILKNTGINLDNVINNKFEKIITSVNNESENEENNKKKNLKNNSNFNKNKLRLENLSPENKNNKENNLILTKNNYERRTDNRKNIKEFYYKSNNNNNINTNKFKNSFVNSQKQLLNQRNITKLNYNSDQTNSINDSKKYIPYKFRFINKNNNIKSNEIINNETKNKNNQIKPLDNSDNNKLKNIQEEINENNEGIIESNRSYNKKLSHNKSSEKFNLDLLKNVIVSEETIERLTKESKIPFFTDKEYKYIRPIGEGAYGLIYLVENIQNKKQYALKKILCKDLYEIYKHKNQLELIYSMEHPNILELYNIQYKYLDSTTYAIYVLMERAQNDWSVDIRKRIINKNPYKEEEIINILKQVVSGLSYLQKKNITHRDIKPQNILLFRSNIFKVADLGEAKNAENKNQKMTLRGSELYMSPLLYERYKNNRKDVSHNPYKSDVFSLGFSVLYAMNLNLNIIENIREFKNMKIIVNSINKDLDLGNHNYSEKLMQIIFKMIESDENKRYDFIELEKELNEYFE